MVFSHSANRKTEAREHMSAGQGHIINRKAGYKVRQSSFQIHVFTINTLASMTSAYFNIHLENGHQYFDTMSCYSVRTAQVQRQKRLCLSLEAGKLQPWG